METGGFVTDPFNSKVGSIAPTLAVFLQLQRIGMSCQRCDELVGKDHFDELGVIDDAKIAGLMGLDQPRAVALDLHQRNRFRCRLRCAEDWHPGYRSHDHFQAVSAGRKYLLFLAAGNLRQEAKTNDHRRRPEPITARRVAAGYLMFIDVEIIKFSHWPSLTALEVFFLGWQSCECLAAFLSDYIMRQPCVSLGSGLPANRFGKL